MQFHQALLFVMDQLEISSCELAQKLSSNSRWIKEITTNSEWKPRFDTVLKICYSINIEVELFLNVAEFGFVGEKIIQHSPYLPPINHRIALKASPLQNEIILHTQPYHISRALKVYRKENGLTQSQLEEKTLFSVNSISLRESNRYLNYPTVTTLEQYCYAYGISLSDFVHRVFHFVREDFGGKKLAVFKNL